MPNEKRYFSEPFASQLRAFCEERERREKNPDATPAKSTTPYMDRKAATQMPTAAQLAYLKRLGAVSLPGSKLEASSMIDELVKAKK